MVKGHEQKMLLNRRNMNDQQIREIIFDIANNQIRFHFYLFKKIFKNDNIRKGVNEAIAYIFERQIGNKHHILYF